jgi:hypothetical protein
MKFLMIIARYMWWDSWISFLGLFKVCDRAERDLEEYLFLWVFLIEVLWSIVHIVVFCNYLWVVDLVFIFFLWLILSQGDRHGVVCFLLLFSYLLFADLVKNIIVHPWWVQQKGFVIVENISSIIAPCLHGLSSEQ